MARSKSKREWGLGSVFTRKDRHGRPVIVAETRIDKKTHTFYSDENGAHFPTEQAALAFLRRLRSAVETGAYRPASKQTLGEYLDEWLAVVVKPSRKATTHQAHSTRLRYLPDDLKAVPLAEIDPVRLQKWVNRLSAAGSKAGKPLSPVTVHAVAKTLSTALSQAVKWDRIVKNPMTRVSLPARPRAEPPVWSPADAARFLDLCPGHVHGPLFTAALYLGLRRGELLGLLWEDVDLDRRIVTVRHNLQLIERQFVLLSPKTGRSERILSIPRPLLALLVAEKARQAQFKLSFGELWHDHGYVFPRADGRPMCPSTVTASFRKFIAEEGFPKITLHGLRHTCATALLASEVPARVVQEWLGHDDRKMTDHYMHVLQEQKTTAADRLEAIFEGKRALK